MRMMASITWIPGQQMEIAARVPAEQARIKELSEQGVVDSLYLAADRSRVWIVLQGKSQAEVEQALASLPLHPYMNVELTPLT
jgi:muconolactone delta-isomerase